MDSKRLALEREIYRWTGIGLLLILLIGLSVTGSYAFFVATITDTNSDNKDTVVTAADLKATFSAGTKITLENAIPGDASNTKTITLENTGNVSIDYKVTWLTITNADDDTVTISNTETEGTTRKALTGVKYTITCDSASVSGTGTKIDMPTTAGETLISGTLAAGKTHTCTLQLFYTDTGLDQSLEMGNTFSASLTATATPSN